MLWKTIGIVLFVCFAKTLAINDTQDLVGVRAVNKAAVTDETRTHREETSTESSDCTGKGLFSGCYYMKLAKYLTGYLGGSYGGLEPNFTPPIAGFGTLPPQGIPSGSIPGTPSSPVQPERENSTTEAWDGSYSWKFYVPEGEISAEENGTVDQNVPEGPGTVVRGSFSFSAPDGSHFRVTYTADERGFLPSGDHLPTSPPIPEAILKALFKNVADEEAGIFDDGSYKEGRG
ncbi:cuticle protein 3-like [Homalodisca vitripennis]|uniref:cuticle protein 3-like n=1 Tax=Homalodisca vitripennis TaxID=197043 RepID=UPI001EE9C4F3|nr:cuticle protein 3-like [Homalodisca vitripennis]